MNFYTEFTQANETEDMIAVCKKYNKDYKIAKKALEAATKMHMMSSSNSKEYYHKLITNHLKDKGL